MAAKQTSRRGNAATDCVLACRVCADLVAHVDLGEAKGAEMRVGPLDRRLDALPEQLVHKLANERPHLLHRLRQTGPHAHHQLC